MAANTSFIREYSTIEVVFVQHLTLRDFRSYHSVDLGLTDGVTVFVGRNGQGKTNLVEAIEFLSTLTSHRVSQTRPLIRFGADQAIVQARVQAGVDDERSLGLEIEINADKPNRARIDRTILSRPRELVGVLRTVVFSPEDLAIVKGDPADRRRFLDELVTTRWPRMAGVRSDYDKVLQQRSSVLKSMSSAPRSRGIDWDRPSQRPVDLRVGQSGRPPSAADATSSAEEGRDLGDAELPSADELTLEVFTDQLAALGAELLSARIDTLAELTPLAASTYADIAPVNNVIQAEYKSMISILDGDKMASKAILEERLRQAMIAQRDNELRRGVCLVGPHRDDIVLSIGELPAKGYASHGECWSLALSLKLGGFQLVRRGGVNPVLVLDDVFAELDAQRRERLAAAVLDAEQVLVTAAVGTDVPESMKGRRYLVHDGGIDVEGAGEEQYPAVRVATVTENSPGVARNTGGGA